MKRYPLVAYFVLAYTFSWSIHVPLALSACGFLNVTPPASLHFLGAYGPMLAALVVTGMTLGAPGLRDLLGRMLRWRVGVGWLFTAAFGPPLTFLLSAAVVRFWSGAWPDFSQFGRVAEL